MVTSNASASTSQWRESAGAGAIGSGEHVPTLPGLSQDWPVGQDGCAQHVSSTQLPDTQSDGSMQSAPFGAGVLLGVLVGVWLAVAVAVGVTVGVSVGVSVGGAPAQVPSQSPAPVCCWRHMVLVVAQPSATPFPQLSLLSQHWRIAAPAVAQKDAHSEHVDGPAWTGKHEGLNPANPSHTQQSPSAAGADDEATSSVMAASRMALQTPRSARARIRPVRL
jgi:hypothetical protein